MGQMSLYSKIKIVYETPSFLVINKPAGLLTHPANRQDKSPSVVAWLLEKYPEITNVVDQYGKKVGEWVDLRPGIVHRLDRETSGLMLIAKTQFAFDYFKKLFAERKIKKNYLALVHGHLKNPGGIIETPLGRIGARQTTRTYGRRRLKEKSAVTQYKVISKYTSPKLLTKNSIEYNVNNYNFSLLEVFPRTGRTHQIRVHLKSIGYPVVCDPLYAGKQAMCPPGLGRMFLHAFKLIFISPAGEAISVEADLPEELENFLKNLQKIEK